MPLIHDEPADTLGHRASRPDGDGSAQPSHPDRGTRDMAEAMFARHVRVRTFAQGAREMDSLAARFPNHERFHLLAMRLHDRSEGRPAALAGWMRLAERFPHCGEAFVIVVRTVLRMTGRDAARALVEARFPDGAPALPHLGMWARAWEEVGEHARVDATLSALLEKGAMPVDVASLHAGLLRRRGDLSAAQAVLERLPPAPGEDAPAMHDGGVADQLAALRRDRRLLARRGLGDTAARNMHQAVLRDCLVSAIARRGTPPAMRGPVGRVVMFNGSLGAGGAERQLVNTAVGLTHAARAGGAIGDYRLDGPVEVACRALDDRPHGDFFLSDLTSAGISVDCYSQIPADVARSDTAVGGIRDVLHLLPAPLDAATARVAALLRQRRPQVVHLWQDGMVLAAGLGAVLAAVPRIVLSVRSAPPPDRPERDRPEYHMLYQTLLSAPGIVLAANSRFAARRYATWLGIDEARVRVIYNGVRPLDETPRGDSAVFMAAFNARVPATRTIGTVMRLDDNKRPLLWLDCAARMLAQRPDLRFIMVGDGPLAQQCHAHACGLGIADRVLFTGRRPDVGFWLRHFDVFVLLSRWEGLPNVLIEAQAAGIPVVTTPAGGAAETLVDGVTGIVLPDALSPDTHAVSAAVLSLLPESATSVATIARDARRVATERFSLLTMLGKTMEAYVE
ncbi:glycosyltransferase [Komagataeibacter swingsii]|uniref:Glycosyltransferase subfamily 4-like N-terminal domain-containing protein n=1 Tax=Komagataeibacter swingsii TaxID=215220 RepID=A0A2V4RLQ1_9PROT|nr:glycosyltransferase [Komagataeibacter swingsii]PYD69595.1 hypothetical protein CFR76_08540 [Komagataeibacter swingsii]GBQ54546.1 glycosyltransferase [Komagataeibacter swingsii DSM 16373]